MADPLVFNQQVRIFWNTEPTGGLAPVVLVPLGPAVLVGRHQHAVLAMLSRLAVEAECRNPERLAQDLLFLINGAYATARVLDPTTARRRLLSLSNAAIAASA